MSEIANENTVAQSAYPFRFTGNGGEYFRIWIVNLLLSLVTLGIYSAWATVRTRRYFYGNASCADSGFEYHASPIAILKGRIAAVAIAFAYVLSIQFSPLFALVLLIPLAIATPFIAMRALRFRAAMSSWRGVHFDFRGDAPGAFGAYVGWPVLGVLTLGLALPWAWFKSAQYGVNGHRFGRAALRLSAGAGQFYTIGVVLALVWIGVAIAIGGGSAVLAQAPTEDAPPAPAVPWALSVAFFLLYLFVYALFTVWRFRTVYQDLVVGDARVSCGVSIGRYMVIFITNLIGLVVTLGLFYPWARVRTAACLIDSLSLESSDIDGFTASERRHEHAFGEELGQALDLGIGV